MQRNYTIYWYETIDSTNTQAQRIMADLPNLSVLAAEHQTAGRGQRGNVWKTNPNDNLTFTIVLKFGDHLIPNLQASNQFVISQAVTLALSEYLKDNGIQAKIKWPNDIYVADKKICGILIENTLRESSLATCIIGIGLNLNQTVFSPDIPNPTSMTLENNGAYNPKEELNKFLVYFDKELQLVCSGPQGQKSSLERYLEKLYRKNESHAYVRLSDNHTFTGIIRGISPAALLQVEDSSGLITEYDFKEIAYII